MRKWAEVIKGKKKIISYGEQVLSNGHRLRWKVETKRRWVHYGKTEPGIGCYVSYLCDKRTQHNNAVFTSIPLHVTCRRCIRLLKEQGDL